MRASEPIGKEAGGITLGGAPARALLRERLESRLEEVEEAVLTRVSAISDPGEVRDPTYTKGLRRAVGDALEYALEAIEWGPGHELPAPVSLLAQARLAARVGVGLDAVLRRYFAGYALLGGLLIEDAKELGLSLEQLGELLSANTSLFDRLLAAVSEEHGRELDRLARTSGNRRFELVRRLLGGEQVDPGALSYDLSGHHLGLLVEGSRADQLLRSLAKSLGRRLLIVRPDQRTAWAWLGGRRPLDPAQAMSSVRSGGPHHAPVALGEPAEGLSGWRLTHRQAAAAMPVAHRGADPVVRYRDVALLASALQDSVLAASLRKLYLAPLERQRDGGETAKETLRAYIAAAHNVTATANALGVDRKTVSARLRAFEVAVDRSLAGCARDLETALALEELERLPTPS